MRGIQLIFACFCMLALVGCDDYPEIELGQAVSFGGEMDDEPATKPSAAGVTRNSASTAEHQGVFEVNMTSPISPGAETSSHRLELN